MRTDFSVVREDRVDGTNTWLLGSDTAVRPARILRVRPRLDPALSPLATKVAARIAPAPTGGAVYTDDRAPVEWLIDSSLLNYAEGRR
jgi:hypothetical protein